MRGPEVSRSRLYHLSSEAFVAPSYVDSEGALQTQAADNVPMISWPNGRWCHQANTFMREQFEEGLSRRGRGGSLVISAQQIGHLIRYCWDRRIDFLELNDNNFKDFIKSLDPSQSKHRTQDEIRQPRQIVAIGRTCLKFLRSVGDQADDDNFLAPNGRIRTIVKLVKTSKGKKGSRTRLQISHTSFPNVSVEKKRSPISQASIDALREQASLSSDRHIRARRQALISLLDATGARRGEIAELTVRSVTEASRMGVPMLRMTTLKREDHERLVPISAADLAFLKNYIRFHRTPTMRRLGKGHSDHGVLFISTTNGEPLTAGALGAEISNLAKAAGVISASCHTFRHRFITKLFVSLIRNHQVANEDEFRRMLLSGEDLKRKVMQWTGHTNIHSLDRYINLAFCEIVNMPLVYEWATVGMALDRFLAASSAWIDELLTAGAASEKVEIFTEALAALKREVAEAALAPTAN